MSPLALQRVVTAWAVTWSHGTWGSPTTIPAPTSGATSPSQQSLRVSVVWCEAMGAEGVNLNTESPTWSITATTEVNGIWQASSTLVALQ